MGILFAGLVPAIGGVALYTFLAVASWSEERRREREAFCRSEILKKLADRPEADSRPFLEMIREEEDNAMRRPREGQKLGGFITAAVGLRLLIVPHEVVGEARIWTVGLIPLFIGVVLSAYAFFLAPTPESRRKQD
ncbi:MAG: hypothetical protein ACE5JR_11675 [Gemmatimonadota bacterium]